MKDEGGGERGMARGFERALYAQNRARELRKDFGFVNDGESSSRA